MKNKELLLEAIDNYDILTPKFRIVLKAIIELSRDNITTITLLKLSKLSHVSRPVVHNAIYFLEDKGFLERVRESKSKTSAFILKGNKLLDIIKDYEAQQFVKQKYVS